MAKKKKSKTKGNKLTSRQLQSVIFKLFRRHPEKKLTPKQVSQKIKVDNNVDSVQHAMDQLTEEGRLQVFEDKKFKLSSAAFLNSPSTFHEGRVDMTRSGAAYILVDDQEDDIYVAPKYINTALHGDRVKIRAWIPRGRKRQEGEIIEVIERARDHFIGTIWFYPKHAILVPDGLVNLDINVDFNDLKGAKDAEKVVVKVVNWQDEKMGGVRGVVTTVLGAAGSNDIEMKSILINNGFQLDFPEEVIQESEHLNEDIEGQVEHRRDIRPITTFTIDPDTAKDFDDALSIRLLENGNWEVGVHIADVTHYVNSGSPLDKEAFERSTSVYLVDRVLPMLPEKLSNELCSLRPHEDKLTFSAIFEFDKNLKITNRWFGKTIIHSNRRFTYEEAQEILESGIGEFAEELDQLNKIAKQLRKEKFKNGAINFETDEVKFKLAEDGTPLEIYVKVRKEAHLLIEDFMLLANKEVAFFMHQKGLGHEIPFIYRVHDQPNIEKLEEFGRFAKELGFEMNLNSPREIADSLNKLSKAAEEDPGLKLLEPLAIRTMAKAEYSADNIGHYGLAFEYYTHFTSPIRRYSDVLAHRILFKNMEEGRVFRVNKEQLQEKCEHISMQERRAMEAERESVKYKQVEFIEKHVGEEFDGLISGIIEKGIFIELKDSKIEGLVSFDSMDEVFEVDASRLKIRGFSSEKVYKIGDILRVKIIGTSIAKRQVEMAWVREKTEPLEEKFLTARE